MATINDVSRLANVSKATVSRVLSGTRGVKEASRQAVLQAAESLNYRPNVMAQNLATQRSNYVGVILSTTDAGHVSTYLPLLSNALKSRGKNMLVNFADNPDEFARCVDTFRSGQCDAIIAVGGSLAKQVDEDDNIITIDGHNNGTQRSVAYDYRFACESSCRYLSSKGHTSIAIILDDNDYASEQVLEGYKTAMQNLSIPINRQLIVHAAENPELAAMNLLNSYSPFTAMIVMRDSHAAIAMKLFKNFNLATPQDVSIMSLEDSFLANQLSPALTCISYPSEKLVNAAMHELEHILNHQQTEPAMMIQGNLVTRDSVANRN
ncbi:LacI family DNA-binding transcriptional regulator [Vibrio palustris]|uniref:HTH-type transcriptional regulator AscG n=1 Tax=Vibrio palustris TaxID=1918946 RepID=A0A1R4B265_9VIBR|nr:LacI family DNA-binding transcriptional regulator [Vibrio palustris]SJL83005.1 HTH-type transcriptional regulator AscG [Vibrio palustris]